jgi:hypothetical protein
MQVDNNGITTAQALGHITSLFNDDRTGRKYFYYTPIEKVLSTGIIELATRFPPQENVNKNDNNINATEIKNLELKNTADADLFEVYAGSPIAITNKNFAKPRKECTASFAVKRTILQGILTAGHCTFDKSQQNIAYFGRGGRELGYS